MSEPRRDARSRARSMVGLSLRMPVRRLLGAVRLADEAARLVSGPMRHEIGQGRPINPALHCQSLYFVGFA
jgi:hypothetical protein